ncbi:helix-turn-helix transcriptional regulator [Lactobacillus sp. ESL0684]|uniref:helix-turn-helix domain-containing protein n=1 Tax=Lactobacillus sp. ESL0684 TaxID=2983213 RepID=UPI0023F82573|nr:helix-turn-helix transcriptional regulator [Lactobacillus sp. ESL0684]WEV43770.1 helix-turn-helix transcriptional regulator [Lactobacillus sp. ESL0684]
MTIGELLKSYRVRQGKTKKDWAGKVISPSYYGKVEQDRHRITAQDLVKLLQFNKVPLMDFFSELDQNVDNQRQLKQKISQAVTYAFYHKSNNELLAVKELVKNSNLPDKDEQLLYIDAFMAMTDRDLSELSEDKQNKLRELIFNIPDFNREKLELYCNFIDLYDLDSNLVITKRVIKQFQKTTDVNIQELLLGIIVNVADNCIEQKRDNEAAQLLEFADQIPTRPEIFFLKNVIYLFANLLKYHLQNEPIYLTNVKLALQNFTILGMPEYGQQLSDFVEKNK